MPKYIRSQWEPNFWENKPCFNPIHLLAKPLSQYSNNWPSLDDLQDLIDRSSQPIRTISGRKLTVVPQDDTPRDFNDHYAPRIFLSGEIQTRTENWHDFFQIISWILFPATKAAINARHYHAAKHRFDNPSPAGRRSPVENMLSLFDECGAIIIASDPALLQLIVDFQWKDLFWRQRHRLHQELSCIIFGHAFNEKLINPYIGMTANSLLLAVDSHCFDLPQRELIQYLDKLLAQYIVDTSLLGAPHDLTPFPVLGLPGWHKDNEQQSFYDNTTYFRLQRRRHGNTPAMNDKRIIYVEDNCEPG
jgi:hypothetical protein